LHLPAATLRDVAEEIAPTDHGRIDLQSSLQQVDPLIEQVLLSLRLAIARREPDLYAQAAAELLAAHVLLRHAAHRPRRLHPPTREEARLRRADQFMHDNLCEPLTLDAIAAEAGVSRFTLLRLFKRAYRETPLKRLTRLRMEEAQRRLKDGRETITETAFACGYENPAHFATAFRRVVGVSPSEFRSAIR
jgi:AraC family transcriptional regulator